MRRLSMGRRLPRMVRACLVMASLPALGGCVVKSLYPVVAAGDRELDQRLVGSWRGNGNESVVITARDSEYLVVFTDNDGKPGRFAGRLGRLGPYRVLDVSPDSSGMGESDSVTALLLRLHAFLLIDSVGAELRFSQVKPDSLEAYLKREPAAVAHAQLEEGLVLTAPTPELRAFFERFAARPGVLDAQPAWTRR